jgi:hypothetical protein
MQVGVRDSHRAVTLGRFSNGGYAWKRGRGENICVVGLVPVRQRSLGVVRVPVSNVVGCAGGGILGPFAEISIPISGYLCSSVGYLPDPVAGTDAPTVVGIVHAPHVSLEGNVIVDELLDELFGVGNGAAALITPLEDEELFGVANRGRGWKTRLDGELAVGEIVADKVSFENAAVDD